MEASYHGLSLSENLDESEDKMLNRKFEIESLENTIIMDNNAERIPEPIEELSNSNSSIEVIELPNNGIIQQEKCEICQSVLTSDLFTLGCEDVFCKTCLSEYIKFRIEESQVLTMPCPNHECHSQITDLEISALVSSELLKKYKRFKKVEELNKEPFLKWCPKPDCEGYDKGSLKKSKLKCNVCKYEFCYYCAEAWHRCGKCKFAEDKEMDDWASKNGIKYCPNCKRKVEKLEGCDHMTCPKCNYEWCWLCGANFRFDHKCIEIKTKDDKILLKFSVIFLLIFIPILLPFGMIIFLFRKVRWTIYPNFNVIPINRNIDELDLEISDNEINKQKILYYFLAVFLGTILSPVYLIIALPLLTVDILFSKYFFKNVELGTLFRIILDIIFYPLGVSIVILSTILMHIAGIILLFVKLYIEFRKWRNPNYMMANNQYGYT